MKKQLILTLAVSFLTSLSQAYLVPGNPNDGIPNNIPLHDNNPYQPVPQPFPPAPQAPGIGRGVIGPARTVRYQDAGTSKVDKVVAETIHVQAYGRLVNEIILRATSNPAEIQDILVLLVDGSTLRLASGTVGENNSVRLRLDPRFSLRVSEITIRAASPILIGPSSRLNVTLGLAE